MQSTGDAAGSNRIELYIALVAIGNGETRMAELPVELSDDASNEATPHTETKPTEATGGAMQTYRTVELVHAGGGVWREPTALVRGAGRAQVYVY